MKLYIKNKLITIGGSSEILDENKQPLYKVKGKIISPTKKKIIMDKDGNVIYIIRNKYWRLFRRTCFIYDSEKNRVAKVKKKIFSIGPKYWVEDYKDEIRIEGKWLSLTTSIMRNDEIIGTIRRKLDLFRDSFSLEAKEDDIEFLLALVIALDNICDAERNDND